MPDYQKMYTTLFNKVSDTITELQEVQKLTEQMYIDSTPDLEVLDFPQNKDNTRPQK